MAVTKQATTAHTHMIKLDIGSNKAINGNGLR